MNLDSIQLASLSLQSESVVDNLCGSNGLPITPNSIKIIGNYKAHVEQTIHPNLVQYVDCFRNKNGEYLFSKLTC